MKLIATAQLHVLLAGAMLAGGTAAQGAEALTPAVDQRYLEQIAALRGDPKVKSALDHVLEIEPQSHRDLIELNEIPAPPFNEERRAARFAELLRESGLRDVTIDEVGNVIGRRPGTGGKRVIAYSAHLDTVFPEGTDVTVRFDGDRDVRTRYR
ncbi:MAG: hypothetical protein U5K38_02105 [Woeseiaceae bacterium]|nr:hypothetical protein [Woeseiaceae bacterium]